jgi:hypothetical protein
MHLVRLLTSACIGAALLMSQSTALFADSRQPDPSERQPEPSCTQDPSTTVTECPASGEPERPSEIDRPPQAAADTPAVRDLDLQATLPISSSVELPDDI